MRRRRNRKLIPVFWLLGIFIAMGIFSSIFAIIFSTNSKVISHITINNIKVSGLNKLEVEETLENKINNIYDDEIILKYKEDEKKYTFKQLELENNIPEVVYNACTIR